MTINQTIALMRMNAERCEGSRKLKCKCRCAGRFHGQEHPGAWLDEQADVIRAQWTRDLEEWQPRLTGLSP